MRTDSDKVLTNAGKQDVYGGNAPVYCFAIISKFYIYIINVNKEEKEFDFQVIAVSKF